MQVIHCKSANLIGYHVVDYSLTNHNSARALKGKIILYFWIKNTFVIAISITETITLLTVVLYER